VDGPLAAAGAVPRGSLAVRLRLTDRQVAHRRSQSVAEAKNVLWLKLGLLYRRQIQQKSETQNSIELIDDHDATELISQ